MSQAFSPERASRWGSILEHVAGLVELTHMGMDQYLLIPFLGDEHPFTSYFDVHQGYKVLTHCHMSPSFIVDTTWF